MKYFTVCKMAKLYKSLIFLFVYINVVESQRRGYTHFVCVWQGRIKEEIFTVEEVNSISQQMVEETKGAEGTALLGNLADMLCARCRALNNDTCIAQYCAHLQQSGSNLVVA